MIAVTSNDLSFQMVSTSNKELVRVHEPDVSLEDCAFDEFEKLKKRGVKLYLGYEGVDSKHTVVPIDRKNNPNIIPRWNQYFLAKTIEEFKLPLESIADVYGNGGFIGTHFLMKDRLKRLFIIDENQFTIDMAMRWAGYHIECDQNFVLNNSEKLKKGHEFEFNNRRIVFSYQSPHALPNNVKIQFYFTSAQYLPGDAGLPPWIELGKVARKRNGTLVFVYSSLCDKMVRNDAKDLKAIHSVLASREKPILMDTIYGPKEIMNPAKAKEWKKHGLIDYGKRVKPQYGHEWRVGMFEW